MNLDQAQQELFGREAAVVEAQAAVATAQTELEQAKTHVEAVTAKITIAADDQIEKLAHERAVAVAHVEAREARREGKRDALVEAQADVRSAQLVVDELVLQNSRASVAVLDGDIDLIMAEAARSIDAKRADILAASDAGHRAGMRAARAKGETISPAPYVRSRFDSVDQVVDALRQGIVHHDGVREVQRRDAGREAARPRTVPAPAPSPTAINLRFTVPPTDDANAVIHDNN